MDYNDAHPSTLHADTHIERAAIIRLIKAHAKDCERRGARSEFHFWAIVTYLPTAEENERRRIEREAYLDANCPNWRNKIRGRK